MAVFLDAADIAILTVTLVISLAIIVPIYGIVVRLRSNFNPKALQLDNEGGAQAHTGPVIKTLYAMTKRVYRLEVVLVPYICANELTALSQGHIWILQRAE